MTEDTQAAPPAPAPMTPEKYIQALREQINDLKKEKDR